MSGLSVGLLLDNDVLQRWQYQALRLMVEETDAEIELIVLNEERPTETTFLQKIHTFVTEFSLWNCYVAYGIIKSSLFGPPEYRESLDINDVSFLTGSRRLWCRPVPTDGVGNELPGDVVSELGETDVVVRFGFGILVGEALRVPRHGVLSFHHGDLSRYRGLPSGFWPFLHGRSTAGVTLQRINETIDGGEVVAYEEVDISGAESYPEVRKKQFHETVPMLAEGVGNLTDPEFTPEKPELGGLYTAPKWKDVLRYLVKRI